MLPRFRRYVHGPKGAQTIEFLVDLDERVGRASRCIGVDVVGDVCVRLIPSTWVAGAPRVRDIDVPAAWRVPLTKVWEDYVTTPKQAAA